MYTIEYAGGVVKDLKNLSPEIKLKALKVVEEILAKDPYCGKPLVGALKGLWKCRIGDYRIIYSIEAKCLVVFVLRIRHRKDVYRGLIS